MTAYPCAAGGAGSQRASTGGKGYAGLIGYVVDPATAPGNANDYREYIAQNVSLTAGTVYYAGFKANIAAASGCAIDKLGLAFTTLPPVGYTSGNFYFVQGAYTGNGPIPLTPTISGPVADVPVASWNNIQGFFMATGNETQLIIGNFGPGYGTVPPYTPPYRPGPSPRIFSRVDNSTENTAYYFIEDVTLQTLPTAGPELTAVCGQTLRLGACGLPSLPGVRYSWSPATGLNDPTLAMPLLTATMNTPANAAWHYTLTVSVPLPGGQLYTTSSSVDVTVSQSPPVTITPNYTGTYCANAPITLTAVGGLPGGGYTWNWPSPSSPTGTMTATGPTLNVAPNITTVYTLTSGCQQTTYTATVSPNCCYLQQLNGTNQYTKLKPKPYIYTASPFTGGPGTYYHVAGTLRLENVSCTLPVGSVLLVGDGTTSNVELGPGAELIVDGATITAACDKMWGGVIVTEKAVGIVARDQGGVPARIEHSFEGIVVQEPAKGITPATFQLRGVEFWNNRQSVELHRYTQPATAADYITDCSFDCDRTTFKKPWTYNAPDDSYYSLRHLAFAGELRAATIANNDFQHALFGAYGLLGDENTSSVNLTTNTFSTFYIAGVLNNNLGVKRLGYYLLDRNTLTFLEDKLLPNTQQYRDAVQDANAVYPSSSLQLDGTYGAFLPRVHLTALGNRFQQLDSTTVPLSDYNNFFLARPQQTGILTTFAARTNNNSFYLLGTGIHFLEFSGPTQFEVQGNGFTHCQIGLLLQHASNIWGTPDPAEIPVVNLTCNTFRRMDGVRTGTTIGVLIGYARCNYAHGPPCPSGCAGPYYPAPTPYYWPVVRLDDPAAIAASNPNKTYMKNWFDDSGNAGTYYAFFNSQNSTLAYYTYGTPGSSVSGNFAIHDYNLSAGNRIFPSGNNGPNTVPGTETCNRLTLPLPAGIQLRGIRSRSATTTPPTTNSLAQNWPNPTAGLTTFAYQLKPGTKRAELEIHRATDGRQVQRLALDVRRATQDITVKDWPKGTYFVTLLVDEVPCATKRLIAE